MNILFLNKDPDKKWIDYNHEFYNYIKDFNKKIYFTNHENVAEIDSLDLDYIIGHNVPNEIINLKKLRNRSNTIYCLICDYDENHESYDCLNNPIIKDLIDLYLVRQETIKKRFIIKFQIPFEKINIFPFYISQRFEQFFETSKTKLIANLESDPSPTDAKFIYLKDPSYKYKFEILNFLNTDSKLMLIDTEDIREITNNSAIYLKDMQQNNIYDATKRLKDHFNDHDRQETCQVHLASILFPKIIISLQEYKEKYINFVNKEYPIIQKQLSEFVDKDYQNYISHSFCLYFPDFNQYYQMNLNLGMSYYKLLNFKKGKYHYKIAKRIIDSFQVNLNIALLEFDANRKDKFIKYAKKALELEFNVPLAMRLALEIYYGHFSEALQIYKRILTLDPLNSPVLTNVYTLASLIDINLNQEKNGYIENLERACYQCMNSRNIHDLLLLISNLQIGNLYLEGTDNYELGKKAMHYSSMIPIDDEILKKVKGHIFDKNTKPRIGFILSDLKKHPVGDLLFLIIKNRDPNLYDAYIYDNTDQSMINNEVKKNIISMVNYKIISGIDDATTIQMIIDDNLDVLIEMMGFTSGNRMHLLRYKVAPKIMSYFAYPFTNGMDTIDYKIVDQFTCPLETQKNYTEKFLYLPHCLQCYDSDIPIQKNYQRDGIFKIHLCCFNNPKKFTNAVIKTFAKILVRAPYAKLFLMYCMWYNDAYLVKLLKTKFETLGVSPDQIHISVLGDPNSYMQRYNNMDIALDPFPYNGGITSHEALYMNTPLIVLNGDDYRARVGVSLLSNLNLTRYIALNEREYVEKTVALMNNETELRDLHKNLRNMMKKTDLGDPRQFSRNFEETIIGVI